MAASNRTTGKADVAALAATVDLAELKTSLDLIWDSALLNRDVSNTIAVSGAATTVNFSGYDTININTTLDTVLTISNLAAGEFKFLIVTKDAGNEITFANATDMSYSLAYNHTISSLIYLMTNKGDSGIIAYPLHKTFDFSALPTPESAGAWQEATLGATWIAFANIYIRSGIWYRINRENLEISIAVSRSAPYTINLVTLPIGFRPTYAHVVKSLYTNTDDGFFVVKTNGVIEYYYSTSAATQIMGTIVIPLT